MNSAAHQPRRKRDHLSEQARQLSGHCYNTLEFILGCEKRGCEMRICEFTLVLTRDPNESEANEVYGVITDGTISSIAGVPQIRFHRQASSLEDAIRSAISEVRGLGLDVERVEFEPSAIVQAS